MKALMIAQEKNRLERIQNLAKFEESQKKYDIESSKIENELKNLKV